MPVALYSQYSSGTAPSIVPIARYRACEIAWHRLDKAVWQAVCGVVQVVSIFCAGNAAWRIHTDTTNVYGDHCCMKQYLHKWRLGRRPHVTAQIIGVEDDGFKRPKYRAAQRFVRNLHSILTATRTAAR